MKEIDFRAWIFEERKMYYNIAFLGARGWVINGERYHNEQTNLFEIMQFIGIYDINGKKIYEKDIVRMTDGKEYIVAFNKGSYDLLDNEENFHEINKKYIDFEIISNIFSDKTK